MTLANLGMQKGGPTVLARCDLVIFLATFDAATTIDLIRGREVLVRLNLFAVTPDYLGMP